MRDRGSETYHTIISNKEILIYFIAFLILFYVVSNLIINAMINNDYEYTYIGVMPEEVSYNNLSTICNDICDDNLTAFYACPCNHCGCWCIDKDYYGLTTKRIRKSCEI